MSKAVAIIVLLGILLFAGCAGNSQSSQQAANSPPPKIQPSEQVPTPKQTYACPDGSIVLNLSSCPKQKCTDGTAYGNCSSDKPKYCSNGALVDDAVNCGCPEGFDKNASSCVKKSVSPPASQPATPPAQTTSPSVSAQDANNCPASSNCQQISDATKKNQCYNKAGQGAMGEVPCCLLIKNDQTLMDNCLGNSYSQMWYKIGSRSEYLPYCQYISDTAKKDACYTKFYACSYLSTEALRQNCYILDKDCEKISDSAKRDDCFVSRS